MGALPFSIRGDALRTRKLYDEDATKPSVTDAGANGASVSEACQCYRSKLFDRRARGETKRPLDVSGGLLFVTNDLILSTRIATIPKL
jgi:hypothetical protein